MTSGEFAGNPGARTFAGVSAGEWRTIGVLLGLYAIAYLDRQIITLLIDPIGRDLGATDLEMGFLQGLGFVLSFALCGPLLGWMVDRYPRRWIIWAGVIVWSLFTAASGFAETYHQLLAARLGVGAGEAALLPAAYSIISDQVEKARLGRAMAVFSMGATIGSSLSYAIGGTLIALANQYGGELPLLEQFRPWQLAFLVVGLLGLVAAFAVFLVPEPSRRSGSQTAGTAPSDHFFRHWRFYAAHFAAFSLLCMMAASSTAWAATYIGRAYMWPVQNIGIVLSAFSLLGGSLGMLAAGTAADWLFKKGFNDAHFRLYLGLVPLITAAAVLAYSNMGIAITLVGLAAMSLMTPFIAVAAAALQLGTPPQRRGLASATFLMIYNLVGFGLGPALIAFVSENGPGNGDIGRALAITFVAVAPCIMLLLYVGLRPMRRAVSEVSGKSAVNAKD